MEINPDIIKKNPEIVQTIKRVRRKLTQTSIYNSNEDHGLFIWKELSRGGGDSYMKQTGMLVVSLRGVNFGFWSRLGCSGQSANILSRQGLV